MIGEDNYHLNQLPKVLSFIALLNYLFAWPQPMEHNVCTLDRFTVLQCLANINQLTKIKDGH